MSKFFIVNEQNFKVMDIRGENPNPNAEVVAYPRKPRPENNQLWHFSNGFIRSALNNYAFEEDYEGRLVMTAYTGSPAQQWRFNGRSIQNGINKCVTNDGGLFKAEKLSAKHYIESPAQHWFIQDAQTLEVVKGLDFQASEDRVNNNCGVVELANVKIQSI